MAVRRDESEESASDCDEASVVSVLLERVLSGKTYMMMIQSKT
jgi:hypothetical protein